MASGPITSWQINGEKMETVTAFIFLGSKITANSDCSHEIKRHLLLRRKAMTNLDSKLKSRHITLLTKVHLVKAMCFSSSHTWIWCENWTIKKAEWQRIDAFELRADSLEKSLMLRQIEGKRRSGQQRMRWLNGDTDSLDTSLSKLGHGEGHGEGQGSLACCRPWGESRTPLSDWTTGYLLISLRAFGLSPPLAHYEWYCCKHLCTWFWSAICFHFSWAHT